MSIKFIQKEKGDKLIEAAKPHLLEIVHLYQETNRSGRSEKGKCLACGDDKSFSVNLAKDVVKCFKCKRGGAGAIGYLIQFKGMKYLDAMEWLANHLNVDITAEQSYVHPDHLPVASSNKLSTDFRNAQLHGSGIPEEAQQWTNEEGITLNRYTAGSLDKQGYPIVGGDMLLHYLDLDGKPIMYCPPKSQKNRPYIRIRFAFPHAHLDKSGKPTRYNSPRNGGNHLWIPESVRKSFSNKDQIKTLIVIEGEKKADALTCRGVPSVGISGIYNFSVANEMPAEFQRLMTDCRVECVVFILDSDYQALGSKDDKPEYRPLMFCSAVQKFKTYFDAYRHSPSFHNLKLFMAHGVDPQYKGMDDLLMAAPWDLDIKKEIDDALYLHTHQSILIRAIDLTMMSEYDIKEIWHLQSPISFMEHHKDELKNIEKFSIGKTEYKYDASKDVFDFLHPIKPGEKYWYMDEDKDGRMTMKFDHINIRYFLKNRGFGKLQIHKKSYRFVQIADNIIYEKSGHEIKEYVQDFTEALNDRPVFKLIMTGDDSYLSEKRLTNMYPVSPKFLTPDPDTQYFIFKDSFWKITSDGVSQHDHKELPGQVWENDVIPFSPKRLDPLINFEISKSETGDKAWITEVDQGQEDLVIDIIQYVKATSDFLWQNTGADQQDERIEVMMCALADKMLAAGYVLCSYHRSSNLKAIIAMDAQDTAKQQGGTGKSIYSTMFEHIIPTVVIPADQGDVTDDKFLYEGVDDRNRLVVFDDCPRNFNFGAFKSAITRGLWVNAKSIGKYFVGLRKMIFNTNFSIRGDDKSYLRRQHIIAFSDFFNEDRTPRDVFGHEMFKEWNYDQWNYFYNFMATCLSLYMKHGLVTFASKKDIQRRKLRDYIGEHLLDFLQTYYYRGGVHINVRWELLEVLNKVHHQYPNLRRWLDPSAFKLRLQAYCKYDDFDYNPLRAGHKDIRDRTGGIEFFTIADEHFDASQAKLNFEARPDFK